MRKPTITSKALWVSEDLCWLYKEYELLWYIIYIVVDKKIISVKVEYNLFDQVDKLLKGNKKSVIEYLKKEKNGQLLLFWLGQELKELLKLSLLINEGKLINTNNYNQFKVKFDENSEYFIGKHPYRVFKTMENLKYFDLPKLKFLLSELLDTEFKIKSGFGEEEMLIDILIFKV